jgi:DNA-binding transcriptional LysR family regulator
VAADAVGTFETVGREAAPGQAGLAMALLQLSYFLAAVEHGSFSAAAEALYIAQPSLSEQIKRLEKELGVTLFVRTNRRLVLTEAGQLLLPSAQRAVAAAREAAESVREVRTLSGGSVAFGTFSTATLPAHRADRRVPRSSPAGTDARRRSQLIGGCRCRTRRAPRGGVGGPAGG